MMRSVWEGHPPKLPQNSLATENKIGGAKNGKESRRIY